MLTKNLFVFPTSRAIRNYINNKKEENQLLNKTLSIGDFFSKVIIPTNNKIFIDNDLRIILLQNAISEINTKNLGIEKSFSKLFKSSEYIFKFFTELSQEGKSIDDIEEKDIYEFYGEHLSTLKLIHKKYLEQLESHNYIDVITISNNYKINTEFIDYFDEIIFFYEGYFSSFEFQIMKKIAEKTKLLINFQINQFNTKNIELFKKANILLQTNKAYVVNLSKKTIIEENILVDKKINHILYPVSQRLDQIGVVKFAITQMVKNGIDVEKIVVILPDEKFASYLKLFDSENYFNFAMGNDIYNTPFYKAIKTINEYMLNEEPKYKEKVIYEGIDTTLLNKIKDNWNNSLREELFFEIFDFFLENIKHKEFLEKLLELKISLETLLFNKNLQIGNISLKDSFKIFLQKLSSITLDDVKSGKVTVIGILESRLADFDGVIVVDFNDQLVPKRSVKDKFLSTKVKEQVGLPSNNDRQNLQKYYYKRTLETAQEVTITYVENEENIMSRFVNELFEKPNIVKKDFSHILHNNIHKKVEEKPIILDIDLSLKTWSASSLKNYLKCKRKYYLSNILKIQEHEINLEPKAYEIGNIIHNILENVIKQNPNNFTLSDIQKNITKYQSSNPYLTFELELWKKRISKFYTKEQILKQNGFKPVYFEKPFKIEHNGINLVGRIDRIDRDEKAKHMIYDYKTSKNLKVDTIKNYENSVDFQLEFYYLASREFDVEKVAFYDLYHGDIKEEIVLTEKLELLEQHLRSLHTKKVSFDKCEDTSVCQMCFFRSICDR